MTSGKTQNDRQQDCILVSPREIKSILEREIEAAEKNIAHARGLQDRKKAEKLKELEELNESRKQVIAQYEALGFFSRLFTASPKYLETPDFFFEWRYPLGKHISHHIAQKEELNKLKTLSSFGHVPLDPNIPLHMGILTEIAERRTKKTPTAESQQNV